MNNTIKPIIFDLNDVRRKKYKIWRWMMDRKEDLEDIKLIQILWDYMSMNHELKRSDCIIG